MENSIKKKDHKNSIKIKSSFYHLSGPISSIVLNAISMQKEIRITLLNLCLNWVSKESKVINKIAEMKYLLNKVLLFLDLISVRRSNLRSKDHRPF